MSAAPEPQPESKAPRGDLLGAIVAWSVRHRALVLAAVFAFAVAGLITARELELDALPDVTGNQVLVLTQGPGLTPSEIERTVTRPVEVALGGLPGLVEQRSLSRYGISSVVAVFDDDVDPWLARQQVAERVAVLEDLPEGVARPELGPHTGGLGEVVQLSIRSRDRSPAELYELIRLQIAPVLRATPGVVEVNLWGGARRTLDVVADPVALAQAGVSLDELANSLRDSTGAVAGSTLPAGPGQVLLRGVFWPTRAAELGAVAVEAMRADPLDSDPGTHELDDHGQTLRVSELAEVVEGARPRIGAATTNGLGETVYVMIQMQRDANALALTDRIHELMPALEDSLPDDIVVDMVYDRSVLVEATMHTVATNLLEGAALVVIVLVLMLGSIRAGLLVATVIPLSMLGAMIGMVSFDVPGNLMSLGAIDFGLLADGAVVMVERAFHELRGTSGGEAQATRSRVVAAMQGVARPMALSVLIIVLVYVPILTLQGVDGKMFRPMALTVVFALLTSLVVALTFIPAAASWLGASSLPKREPALVRLATRIYEPLLNAAIARPLLIALVSVALLVTGGYAFSRSGTSFIPQLDEGDLVVMSTRQPDVSLETAIAEAGKLETALLSVPEVLAATSRIGSPEVATDIMGLEQADVFVELRPRDQWRAGLTREALIAEIDAAIARDAPGADLTFTQPIQMRFNELVGGSVADVAVSIYGEDQARLRATAEELLAILTEVPGAQDVKIFAPPAVSLIEVRPRLLEARRLDMTPAQILDIVGALRMGVEVGETWDGPVRVPIRLRLAHEGDGFTLDRIPIATPGGEVVPLSRVAEIVQLDTPALVNRQAGQRRIVVGFNVRGAELGDVVEAAQAKVEAELDQDWGARLVWGGQYEQLEEARARLAMVVPILLVAIFGLLVIVFRRPGPAAVIFLNVPFAGVGGALALWSRAMPVSISAAIGFIALSGIAVLNGVVLMSSVVAREDAGAEPREAAREAARERMRPVLMTALVAALGFVPMALATGIGAEVQRPLATVVVGGLVTSTFLTLVLLPALYPWLRLARRRTQVAAAAPSEDPS
ncbi:Cobalt-zinc-cadmium resistance protein CzcA [Enhygromyxa salina]|uniref:Cobalt-zinc-cadmium resistance protein CzcA n=1 Tax=Enhygromyxa salina TaxID=215803 RepID=A0A2S9XDF3_9BACT|nr:CusA/CzcA family heavy metal efflux RND transporter [Enhygromyxa salina]PRP90883.1 Cobalt-zinc-cadmium resistance protein CzcA [Enhygromyxa salina]